MFNAATVVYLNLKSSCRGIPYRPEAADHMQRQVLFNPISLTRFTSEKFVSLPEADKNNPNYIFERCYYFGNPYKKMNVLLIYFK